MSDIAWYYNAAKNPDGHALIGVPLRDLTEADMAEFPDHTTASIDASDLYRKTKPPAPKPDVDEEPFRAPARRKAVGTDAALADSADDAPREEATNG